MVKFLDLLKEIKVAPPSEDYTNIFKKQEVPNSELNIFFKSRLGGHGLLHRLLSDTYRLNRREVSGNTEVPAFLKYVKHPNARYIIELLDLLPVSHTVTQRKYTVNLNESKMSLYINSSVYLKYESPYFHTDQPTLAFAIELFMSKERTFPDARVKLLSDFGYDVKEFDISLLLQLFKDNPEEFYETLKIT